MKQVQIDIREAELLKRPAACTFHILDVVDPHLGDDKEFLSLELNFFYSLPDDLLVLVATRSVYQAIADVQDRSLDNGGICDAISAQT